MLLPAALLWDSVASTYVLSRVSVVHHAALNCVRRVFAVVVTSAIFGLPISFAGVCGIMVSLVGFVAFTWSKARHIREREITPTSLPSTLSPAACLSTTDLDLGAHSV